LNSIFQRDILQLLYFLESPCGMKSTMNFANMRVAKLKTMNRLTSI